MPTPEEYKRLTEKHEAKWSGNEGQRRAVHPYVKPAATEAAPDTLATEQRAIRNLPKGDL